MTRRFPKKPFKGPPASWPMQIIKFSTGLEWATEAFGLLLFDNLKDIGHMLRWSRANQFVHGHHGRLPKVVCHLDGHHAQQ